MDSREEKIMSLRPLVGRVARTFPPPYEDRVQDGMVGAIEAVDHFDGRGTLVGWAHKRVRGAILDAMRHDDVVGREERRKITAARREVDADPQGASVALRARAVNPRLVSLTVRREAVMGKEDPAMARTEASIDVRKAMATLPVRERGVMQAYYWEGWLVNEIADALGVTESRVSQIIVRSRRRLRAKLIA